jgi:hypothetical protein
MLIRTVGPERMMLGSDGVANLGVEIAKHHAIGLETASLGRCLGGTAKEVFQL